MDLEDEEFTYTICKNCWWEQDMLMYTIFEDGTTEYNLDDGELGPNNCTLREARANYAEYGACGEHAHWCKTGSYPKKLN
jgi:hypothetical protein